MRLLLTALLLLGLLALAPAARAEEELPPSAQALLLLRVLGYDRGLPGRTADHVTIAVLWRTGDEAQRDEMLEAIRTVASRFRVAGLPVRAVPVLFVPGTLEGELRGTRATAVVLTGGLSSEAARLAPTFQALRLLSASVRRDLVEKGVALGLVRRGDRAAILVNVGAARSAGADFDSSLFTVAETVDARPTR